MGNKQAQPRSSARKAAAFLAALGALVMSSGVALMVAATPANAAQSQHVPVGVCHATSSDTNPYVFIVVDDDSTKLKGHLMHRDHPNKTWKNAGTYELGGDHAAGDAKRDYIASYTGTDGVFHALDGDITAASCDAKGDVEMPPAVADVDFTDPTCANSNEASYDTTGDHVSFAVAEGSAAPGAYIKVVATADEGYAFENESATQTFEHTFGPALNLQGAPCQEVNPPQNPPTVVSPPQTEAQTVVKSPKTKTKSKTQSAVTPTVVEAGLVSTSAQDLRGEQGLALMVAGTVMLVAAGGLGLRVRSAARI